MVEMPNPDEMTPKHTTSFELRVNGLPLDDSFPVEAIEIAREVNRIPRATIIFQDGSPSDQDFTASSSGRLDPGGQIEILAGYGQQNETVFKGVITRHRVEVRRRRARLVIEAKDAAFVMALARMSRNFADQSDADVLGALVAGWPGLSAEIALPGGPLPQIVQHQASDWDFLVMRAEQNSAFVIVTDGKVAVLAPSATGLPIARGIYGETLQEATLELDAEGQLGTVEVGAWDPAEQALAKAEESDAAVGGPGALKGADIAPGASASLRHGGARDQAELAGWAKAEMMRSRRTAVRGTLTVQGNAAIQPGTMVELGGLGTRFAGQALVTGLRHRIARGVWNTEVMLGSDPRPHAQRFPVAAPAAGGHLPPIVGLQIGLVMALEGDPAGEARVQVRLPMITSTDGLLWARIAHAGAARLAGS